MSAPAIAFTAWPYVYIACYFLISFMPSPIAPLGIIGIYVLAGLIPSFSYGYSAKGIRRPDLCRELAEQNRRIKLRQLPCDILVWGVLLVMWIETYIAASKGAMGIGMSNLIMLIIAVPYGVMRLIMIWSAAAVCKEVLTQPAADYQIPVSTANFHIFLHLLPVTDIISAILVNRKLNEIAQQEKQNAVFTDIS